MTEWPLRWLMLPMLLAMATWAWALDAPPVRIESRSAINDLLPQSAATVTHVLALSVANIDAWPDAEMIGAVRHSAQILAQCGIGIVRADLLRVATPESHRHFDTPRSRELALALALPKPTFYFAAGTRQIPAFDAEAIGSGNSRTRPEFADTVWIAQGARDLGIVVARELEHVLMDSGGHDNTPGNLMAESTAPQNTQLTTTQCERLTATGQRHGLLRGVD